MQLMNRLFNFKRTKNFVLFIVALTIILDIFYAITKNILSEFALYFRKSILNFFI